MKYNIIYLILLIFILFGCSQTNSNKALTGEKHLSMSDSEIALIDSLNIQESWTEITCVNDTWTYSIPCPKERNLQTIEIKSIDKQAAIIWNTGLEAQGYVLKKIDSRADSIVFETVLPYDRSSVVLFSFRYLDKGNNIVIWSVDGTYCTYIPTQDTSKYIKTRQECIENKK